MQDYRDLHHMGWIEQVPPSQWSWVQKEYGLPAMELGVDLVKELGVNPDFLDQVKDFLDKPVDPDILGQTPPTVSNLQVHISKQESTSSNSSDSNSPDSNPTLPGSPEVPTDTSGHSTPAGAPASAPAGAPPETMRLRVCWEDQVGGLIGRKMLYGFGPKSVISILEKVVFYLKKLRWIASLPPQEKGKLRESTKKEYLKNINTYSAWGRPDQCNQLL